MSDHTRGANAVWLIEPPAPGQIAFHFSTGPDTEMTPSVTDALTRLAVELGIEDTRGFIFASPLVPQAGTTLGIGGGGGPAALGCSCKGGGFTLCSPVFTIGKVAAAG
jgi:hypothetical protein